MVRVPLPDEFEQDVITVAGTHDHDYGQADVNLEDARHARNLKVNEGEPGYVAVGEHHAAAVAEYLDTAVEDPDDPATCQVVKADGDVCGRDLPCPYHSE